MTARILAFVARAWKSRPVRSFLLRYGLFVLGWAAYGLVSEPTA
jgi:hypothetical protein